MKRTLLILSFLVGAAITTNAQCTPDNSQTDIGANPTTLAEACENQTYDETVTLTIKKDAQVGPFTVNVDSAYITDVVGKPAGLSYNCHNANCFIKLDGQNLAHGCVSINGVPTEVGTKTMTIKYKAFAQGQEINNSYNVDITINSAADQKCAPQNIFDVQNKSNTLGVYPNPSNGQELNFNSTLHNVSIVDQLGNIIYTAEEADSVKLQAATKGIYFLKADEGIEKIIIK